jgi:hypothetical protein
MIVRLCPRSWSGESRASAQGRMQMGPALTPGETRRDLVRRLLLSFGKRALPICSGKRHVVPLPRFVVVYATMVIVDGRRATHGRDQVRSR